MKEKNIGSTFDSWLCEEGLLQKVSAAAVKRHDARQVEGTLQQKGPGQNRKLSGNSAPDAIDRK
jgi:hypothetical protein